MKTAFLLPWGKKKKKGRKRGGNSIEEGATKVFSPPFLHRQTLKRKKKGGRNLAGKEKRGKSEKKCAMQISSFFDIRAGKKKREKRGTHCEGGKMGERAHFFQRTNKKKKRAKDASSLPYLGG